MRRFSIAAIAAVFSFAFAQNASANTFNWSGCYLSGGAGHSWGISKQTYGGTRAGVADAFLPDGADMTGNYQVKGLLVGGGIGCNHQAGNWVVGLEGDGSYMNAAGLTVPNVATIAAGANPSRNFTTDQQWLATLRVRAGHTFVDRWMLYVTGGAAWTGLVVNNHAALVASNAARVPDRVIRLG